MPMKDTCSRDRSLAIFASVIYKKKFPKAWERDCMKSCWDVSPTNYICLGCCCAGIIRSTNNFMGMKLQMSIRFFFIITGNPRVWIIGKEVYYCMVAGGHETCNVCVAGSGPIVTNKGISKFLSPSRVQLCKMKMTDIWVRYIDCTDSGFSGFSVVLGFCAAVHVILRFVDTWYVKYLHVTSLSDTLTLNLNSVYVLDLNTCI